MLIFTLKKEWFEKIADGRKKIKYCEKKKYWEIRLWRNGVTVSEETPYDYEKNNSFCAGRLPQPYCILQLGYTKKRLIADIKKAEVISGINTDLHFPGKVYAITLTNVRNCTEAMFQNIKMCGK